MSDRVRGFTLIELMVTLVVAGVLVVVAIPSLVSVIQNNRISSEANTLVAAFNPQLAAWSHSPFAAEVEAHLIRCFGERFGYERSSTSGCFCSGGAEANHTALLLALTRAFPEINSAGLRSLPRDPVFYVTTSAHDSFRKAARMSGLGDAALCREWISQLG